METTLEQIRQASETWRKMLEILQQENVLLKNQLTELLKLNIPPDLLEKAEFFQNQFLFEDERIAYLRKDNAQLSGLLRHALYEDESLLAEARRKLDYLKKEMYAEESEFKQLKISFNVFADELMEQRGEQVA